MNAPERLPVNPSTAPAAERGDPSSPDAGPPQVGGSPQGGQRPAPVAERGDPSSPDAGPPQVGGSPQGGQRPAPAAERGGPSTRAAGTSHFHESAIAQVAGAATYVDDIPEVRGTLHAAPVCSPVAHGILRKFDATAALAQPGVRAVIDAGDIPGDVTLAAFAHDEPVFALDTVQFAGQVIALVIADDAMTARRAARLVQLDIEPLDAVLSVHEAHALEHYVLPSVHVKRGDAEAALKRAPHQLEGRFEVGGQEHFYLEGQVAYVLPLEQNQWWVYTSTQHPGEVQHWVSHALGIANHAVTVECRRMGGGFGGKETQAGHLAVWAAVAADRLQCPVKLRLDRDDDFMITGKRHPFAYHYRVGFDDSGLLCGMELEMLANCGFSADLSGPVADRAVFHADNAYFLEDVAISSYRCKTNTQSHAAFRGFGGPQGVIVIERILSDIAQTLGLDPLDVRLRNLYGTDERNVTHYQMAVEDDILDPLINQLALTSGYRERREQIAAWNARSPVIKRGLALTPVKFGISFTATLFNQAGALVHVYTDGSVQVNHGGTEMGQGLNTKIAQIVADELGIPFGRVLATAADTSKVPNASATAASAGTDLNGRAAQFAARTVRNDLAAFVAGLDGLGAGAVRFEGGRVVAENRPGLRRGGGRGLRQPHPALERRLLPTPKIHYDKTTLTGRPFLLAYGAACTEVAIDTLTGESRVLKVDILHDVGAQLNPAIDIGQIEGGFVQGMGWLDRRAAGLEGRSAPSPRAVAGPADSAAGDVPAHL